jgi:DNA-binding NarL/FixJ family response regulator
MSLPNLNARKQILILDDHPMTRRGVAQLISHEPDLIVCGEADSAHRALAAMATSRPDLVLADIAMPGKSGLEFIKDARALYPGLAILVMSMHDETLFAERVLRAGARGYVMKSEGGERVLEAIRQVLQGEVYLSKSMSAAFLDSLTERRSKTSGVSLAALTDREFEVFQLLGQGFSTNEIGERLHLSIKTIGTHRVHIKKKLGLKTGAELMKQAVRWAAAHPAP